MKIFHINNIASTATIFKSFLSQEHDVTIFNIIPQQKKPSFFYKTITLIERLFLIIKVRKKIKKEKPDILHIHYTTSGVFFLDFKGKVICHAHGSDVRIKKHDYFRRVLNYLIFKKSFMIIYATPDLSQYFEVYKEKTMYLPNPIDTKIYTCNKNTSTSKKILLFSMPTTIKGIELSSKALKYIAKKHPDIEIDVFDTPKSREIFEDSNISYISIVKQEDIPSLICNYDIIVGQFKIGSLGMSELQAMSCSKPVICNAYLNESYSGSPHLQASSQQEIIDHIEILITKSHEDKQLLGGKNRAWIIENHEVSKICKKLIEVYIK